MSESKHTPGPWRLGRAGGTVVAGDPAAPFGEDRSTEAYYGGDLIAESIGRDADATLIARAPDLLRENEELKERVAALNRVADEWARLAGQHAREVGQAKAQNAELLGLLKEAHTGLTHGGGLCAACGAEPGCDIDCPVCRWTAKVDATLAKAKGGAA